MGRNRNNNVRDYFVYEQSSKTSTCTVGDCFSVIKSDHNGNLLKHLQTSYSEIYEKVKAKSAARKSVRKSKRSLPNNIRFKFFENLALFWNVCLRYTGGNKN